MGPFNDGTRMGRLRRAALAAAVATSLAGTLTACGGDDSSDSGSSSGASTQATTANTAGKKVGDPIVVHNSVGIDTQLGSFPESVVGVEAAARRFNAAGGLEDADGVLHKVEVETCNTQLTAPGEAACARDAIKKKAVSEVGSFIVINAKDYENTLTKGGIPDLASIATTPDQFAPKNVFPLQFGQTQAMCTRKAFLDISGGKKVANVSYDIPGSATIAARAEAVAKKQGVPIVGVNVSPTTTDFGPVVQQISEAGADVVVFSLGQAADAGIMLAAQAAGKKFTYCLGDLVWTSDQLKKIGPATQDFYVSTWWPQKSEASKIPLLQQFVDDVDAQHEAGDDAAVWTNGYANKLNGWLGMHTLQEVVKTMKGPITNETFMDALSGAKVTYGGIMDDIDFAKPRGASDFPRVFNPNIGQVKWDGSKGTYVAVPDSQVNMIELLFK